MDASALLAVTARVMVHIGDRDAISESLGATFEDAPGPGGDEQTAHNAPGLSLVTLRISPTRTRVEMVPSVEPCITWEDVRTRFGFSALVPIHPGAPTPELEWWQYPEQTSARLSIGFERGEERCAARVVVESR